MDLVKLNIPLEFILARVDLSWTEVLFGIDQELVSAGLAVELAERRLEADDSPSLALVDLASPSRVPIRQLLEPLVAEEVTGNAAAIRAKWLFLVLAWLYAVRDSLADSLEMVAMVHADFGYPREIDSFINWLPASADITGLSQLAARERLVRLWGEYVDAETRRYREAMRE